MSELALSKRFPLPLLIVYTPSSDQLLRNNHSEILTAFPVVLERYSQVCHISNTLKSNCSITIFSYTSDEVFAAVNGIREPLLVGSPRSQILNFMHRLFVPTQLCDNMVYCYIILLSLWFQYCPIIMKFLDQGIC
jgi:hypothetical protein